MRQPGYEAQSMLTEALQFGLPARRRRVYICFVKQRNCKFDFHDRPLADAMPLFKEHGVKLREVGSLRQQDFSRFAGSSCFSRSCRAAS